MASGNRKYTLEKKEYKECFKLSEIDHCKLLSDAQSAGMDKSKYLRALVQSEGKIDVTFPMERANLIRQLAGIATNVNQIAKVANTKSDIYFRDIDEIIKLLEEVKRLLAEVLKQWQLRRY